jgi:hypothetical protein
VELVSGTVLASFQVVNERLLDSHGTVTSTGVTGDGDGGITATWELSWPAQQASPGRLQPTRVPAVQVRASSPAAGHTGISAGSAWETGHCR